MTASPAAVAVVMEFLTCERGTAPQDPDYCIEHTQQPERPGGWTERGCAVAVAVADAVAAIAAREALKEAAAMLAPPDPHTEDEECETCFTVRWLRSRAVTGS